MRGHTGGGISMGRGFTIVSSSNQNLNMRISTETEIVAVYDCMPDILWTRYWLDDQGYDFLRTFYTKTIKVLLFWKITTRLQSVSAQRT